MFIWLLIKITLSANGPFFVNKTCLLSQKLSQTPRSSFRGAHVGQTNASYEDSFTTCQSTPENHGSLLDCLLKHAASITEIPSQDRLLLTRFVFWQGFTDPPPSTWTSTCAPLRRRTFADRSRKYPSSQTLAISGGSHRRKKRTPGGLGVWLLQSLPFGKLGCCMWSFFLDTSKKHH